MSCNVVIVVPLYKENLDECEQASLHRLLTVLGKYPICFMLPQSLKANYVKEQTNISFLRLPDKNFINRTAYSKLMLTPDFYESFADHEYMLVYQLDAFVFSDKLAYFCGLNYDYIGAPMLRYKAWRDMGCHVGNGGLSLRRIKQCMAVTRKKQYVFDKRPQGWKADRFLAAEDYFFSYCGVLSDIDFSVAPAKIAIKFSVGIDCGHIYDKIPNWLPFGCHAWSHIDYPFWKGVIEKFGYKLPQSVKSKDTSYQFRIQTVREYLLERLLRKTQRAKCIEIATKCLPADKSLHIWGFGAYGKMFMEFAKVIDKSIAVIYDISNDLSYSTLAIEYPTAEKLAAGDEPVIICTEKYFDDISQQLNKWGIEKKRPMYSARKIFDRIIDDYVNRDVIKLFRG